MVEYHIQIIDFLKVEIKDYNVIINGKIFFDQLINNDHKTYGNIKKIATGKGDGYTTGCFSLLKKQKKLS